MVYVVRQIPEHEKFLSWNPASADVFRLEHDYCKKFYGGDSQCNQ